MYFSGLIPVMVLGLSAMTSALPGLDTRSPALSNRGEGSSTTESLHVRSPVGQAGDRCTPGKVGDCASGLFCVTSRGRSTCS
ncbi:hypothetical protein WAI453_012190 [Rhynchosporium graminicola]|uniref:Uncharacterized protein n=1 Tax=Rhynchosporium graminicola TaxID=2792576 RepID=A0A1E1KXL1_9HELO|nr:uncharacterized protein RCO7_06025 [Rhynchosporium commune]